jgi:hypothetical protein
MASSELAPCAARQVFFKRAGFTFGLKSNRDFDSPWPVLRSVETIASIAIEEALFEITRNAGVVAALVQLTHQNVNVKEVIHLAGLPSGSLWSA